MCHPEKSKTEKNTVICNVVNKIHETARLLGSNMCDQYNNDHYGIYQLLRLQILRIKFSFNPRYEVFSLLA